MDRTIKILAGVLTLQVIGAVGLMFSSDAFDRAAESPRFIDVDASLIDEIVVSAPDKNSMILRRVDESWTLPEHKNLPVDEDKRSKAMERLVNSKAAWPVATSTSAAERFEVTQDNHQRRVVLRSEDSDLMEFYLGTSPGFRQVHARRAGDDDIFAIDFNNYELPTGADDWLDKKLLQPSGEITAIETRAFKLTKQDDKWSLEALSPDTETDESKADSLASALKSLRVTGAAADEASAGVEGEVPTFSYAVETDAGSYSYAFYEGEDEYLVKGSSHEGYFRVTKYTGDRLKIDREELVKDSEEIAGNEGDENTSG